MENNRENKAKFFALYYGQRLKIYPITVSILKWEVTSQTIDNCHNLTLGLTALSSISDDDHTAIMFMRYGSVQPYKSFRKDKMFVGHFNQQQIDYLRSKGYAVPFMDLSVEQQLEYGWITLN